MRLFFFYFVLILLTFPALAQEEEASQELETAEQTIVEEFDQVVEDGGNYQDYKVIKKAALSEFKNQLKANKEGFEAEMKRLNTEIAAQKAEISKLNYQMLSTQNALEEAEQEKSSMQLFGNNIDKGMFQVTVFGVIGVLALILILVLIKFKANSSATKEAKASLETTEKEFEEYKRKALEKQQILGRQLQDEKNKVSKLKAGGLK